MTKAARRSLLFLGSAAAAMTLLFLILALASSAAAEAVPAGSIPAASASEASLSNASASAESASAESALAATASAATAKLLFADDHHLGFTLEIPPVSIPADGRLAVPGLDQRTAWAGLPELPYYSTYIVVPPDSTTRLTLEHAQPAIDRLVALPAAPAETVDVPALPGELFPLMTIPAVQKAQPLAGPGDQAQYPDAATTPGNIPTGFFPSGILEVSEPMMFRDVGLVRVSLYPIQYDSGRQMLRVTPEMRVVVDFERKTPVSPVRLAPSVGDQHVAAIANLVLNPGQIAGFRGLPSSLDDAGSALPVGVDLFKIGVVADGIHELTYQTLKDAGMAVDEVDPATLEMMYRGQMVATAFSGDSDASFEPGESLRFYGQVFDGSRLERQFITENIYWLWAGGQARPINTLASVAGQPVTSYLASLTREPESIYFQGFTNYWPENEPDAWYWDWWTIYHDPITRTYAVTLPNPTPSGPPAQFTAEFTGRDSHIADQSHSLAVTMNGYPAVAARSWLGEANFNVSATLPLTAVLEGRNDFYVRSQTQGTYAQVALNRITVDYQRALTAIGDQLIFGDQPGGAHQYQVRGFSHDQPARLLAWDVTDPFSPTAILTSSLDISGSGPYTVSFGRQSPAGAGYILTSLDNVITPASISIYVAPQLDPPSGAEWLAIAYKDFMTETLRLAAHRSNSLFGGLSTHVVDVEDVINEYGYGLPIPAAIHDYLAHALSAWSVKPSYVLLVGDTTLDPRHIKSEWTDPQYVPTDLPFVDRYNGQIPSDLLFALLSGADILPDLAVGRLAVKSADELGLVIDKIVNYDENQRLSFGWMQNFLFVADKFDPSAGDFCGLDMALAGRLPPSLNSEFLCLDNYVNGGPPDAEALRADMLTFLDNTGATLLTYRGHGSIDAWGGNPVIFSLALASDLANQQPFVVASGDCLDGYYAWPLWDSLGERLVSLESTTASAYGAAAHWGSSGLGVSSDHTDILNGFYDGLFIAGATALGDAASYAKLAYYLAGYNDLALMYSFNLQGDPAMHLMRPSIELQGAWQQDYAKVSEPVTLTLTAQNHGIYPALVTLAAEPIAGFNMAAISGTVALSTSMAGGATRITLQFGQQVNEWGIPRNGQATVTITYDVAPDAVLGPRVAHFKTEALGLEVWPGDEQIDEQITVLRESIWLPALRR